jgi:hypothetical protein
VLSTARRSRLSTRRTPLRPLASTGSMGCEISEP